MINIINFLNIKAIESLFNSIKNEHEKSKNKGCKNKYIH